MKHNKISSEREWYLYTLYEPSGDEWFEKFGAAIAWNLSKRTWLETIEAWIKNTP